VSDWERFLRFVPEREPGTCWLWTGGTSGGGAASEHRGVYGRFAVGSRTDGTRRKIGAHVFAFVHEFGPVPDGKIVCHHCDTPLCVNPAHLYAGTHATNVADAEARGRAFHRDRATGNGKTKLTVEQVAEIRAIWAEHGRPGQGVHGSVSQVELARRYGVTRTAIRAVLQGRVS